MPALSIVIPTVAKRLPTKAQRDRATKIIARHEQQDGDRIARVRNRLKQLQEAKAARAAAVQRFSELWPYEREGTLMRESTRGWDEHGHQIKDRTPDLQLLHVNEEIALWNERIEQLQSENEPACLTAARITALLNAIPDNAKIADCSVKATLRKGETKPDALARVRRAIIAKREERDTIARKGRTKAEMKQAWREQCRAMAARGTPRVRALLEGGAVEFATTRLPRTNNPFFQHIPDGAALIAYLFESELMRKVEELIDFNADDSNAMPAEDQQAALANLDAEIMQLRREEAALVESIVADGGEAFHFPDAPIEAVLDIEIQ
jgi:hypothetical protein